MTPKPYIELADFPSLTPFTAASIEGYMARRELLEGVHYFRMPATGKRPGKPVFKWSAIEKWIEERSRRLIAGPSEAPIDLAPVRRRA